MNLKTTLSLIISLILTVSYLSHVQTVTDAELEALEKQIEQQETVEKQRLEEKKQLLEKQAEEKRKKEAKEKQRLAEEEKQRQEEQIQIEEEKKKQEKARLAELERKQQEEERLKVEKEKKEKYNKHIKLAKAYMSDDKFDKAISEYQIILQSFPEDIHALDGISEAQKYLNACDDIVGTWYIEPNGITWEIHDDNTVFGTWLIFSHDGLWECVNARNREVVVSWPGCGVCTTEYFFLSEDINTLKSSRNTGSLGKRIIDSKKDTTSKKHPSIGL